MRKKIIIGAGLALAGGAGAAAMAAYRTWGVDVADATRALPGDDLIAEPTGMTTRSLIVDAPPGAIWPWLAQMGYGRGGWYSYDRLDMKGKSATEVKPEWQGLAVGDLIPTDPKGGFEARVVDPSHALVMYTDTALVDRQRGTEWRIPADERVTPGLRFSGAMLQTTPREFAVSWAMVLDPIGEGRTRLIERVRVRYDGAYGLGPRLMGSLVGFGVFIMVQRQMLTLKRLTEGRRPSLTAEGAREIGDAADAADGSIPEVMIPAGIE